MSKMDDSTPIYNESVTQLIIWLKYSHTLQ